MILGGVILNTYAWKQFSTSVFTAMVQLDYQIPRKNKHMHPQKALILVVL